MTENTIIDYAGYDYKKDFWSNKQRQYEDSCERNTIQRCLKKIGANNAKIMDAGCGFGRLFPSYSSFGRSFVLFDYAQNMLDEAKESIDKEFTVEYLQGSLYEIPYDENELDVILSVRTLHHLNNPGSFFSEAHRLLKKGGHFIFEIPNKRHVIEIARFILRRSSHNPFSSSPYERSKDYYNFHPTMIKKELQSLGFSIISMKSTSFFRHRVFKSILPHKLLVLLDSLCQQLLSFLKITPSIFVTCKKI